MLRPLKILGDSLCNTKTAWQGWAKNMNLSLPVRRSVVTDELLLSASVAHQVYGDTHEELVAAIRSSGLVHRWNAMKALEECDRKVFVTADSSSTTVYKNAPTTLCKLTGATMSAPAHHAQILDLIADWLQPIGKSDCLEVGSGTGVLCALLSAAGARRVRGVELNPHLHERAVEISASRGFKGIEFECANGMRQLQSGSVGPPGFDVIIVTPCVEEEAVLETIAYEHLKVGGRLLGPVGVGGREQRLVALDKVTAEKHDIERTSLHAVLCQPMLAHGTGEELIREAQDSDDGAGNESSVQELEDVKYKLNSWKDAFAEAHGQPPSREDMMSDDKARVLFERFALLRKRLWED